MKIKECFTTVKNFHIDCFLIKIISSDYLKKLFGALFSRKIHFFLYKNLKTSVITRENFFLDACLRCDEKLVATLRNNNSVNLFNIKRGVILNCFYKKINTCRSISFSKDGTTLITTNEHGHVITWDIFSNKISYSIKTKFHQIHCITQCPQTRQIYVISGYDGFLRLIDFRVSRFLISSFNYGCPIESFKFINSKKMLIAGGNFLKIWDLNNKKFEVVVKENCLLSHIDYNYQDNNIVYSKINFKFKMIDCKKNKIRSVFGFKKYIISFSHMISYIALGFFDEIIIIKNFFYKKKEFLKNIQVTKFYGNKGALKTCLFFITPKRKKNLQKNSTFLKYLNIKHNKIYLCDSKPIYIFLKKKQFKNLFGFLFDVKTGSSVLTLIKEILCKNGIKNKIWYEKYFYFLIFLNLISKTKNKNTIGPLNVFLYTYQNLVFFGFFFGFFLKTIKYIELLNIIFKNFFRNKNLKIY